jgi:probable rRNA maturation factor
MSPEGSSILFKRCPNTLDRKRLRAFHKRLRAEVTAGSAFTCLITRDDQLRQLNRDFLGLDYPTDVLSFPIAGAASLGDLAVSFDRAEAQAARYGHGIEDEIEILMLHGTLHLLGMDHETDKGRMARAEASWRGKLGLPNGLIGRARSRA